MITKERLTSFMESSASRWVAIAFIVALFFQMAWSTVQLFSSTTVKTTISKTMALNLPNQPMALAIPAAHLFGDTHAPALPETTLPLILQGIFLGNDSAALISNAGAAAQLYHLNDALPGGVTINKISPTQVILDVLGRLYTLSLKTLPSPFSPPEPSHLFQ